MRNGDDNGARKHPERLARGNNHWTRKRSERLIIGDNHHSSKLTEEIVRKARKEYADGVTIADLARKYGVTEMPMSCALKRKTWKHVD